MQYRSVFVNLANPFYIRVTAFLINYLYRVNIIIYKKYSFFIVFVTEKGRTGFINSKIIDNKHCMCI